MILISAGFLQAARHGVATTQFSVGQTPVTEYAKANADGPVVIMAHGFAGSQQMMQGYALPLARAGYRVVVFEFLGHGRHTQPMSGNVSSVDGTTRLLVKQTSDVIDAVAQDVGPVALLGHSMATDVLVRVAAVRADIGPVVLISAFSKMIDATNPTNLLLVTGAWEPGLRDFGEQALRMVNADASEGQTVRDGTVLRRTVAAPFAEHVSILHSRVGRSEALAWLDQAYGRSSDQTILPTGWAILGMLCGLVLLFRPLTGLLPNQQVADPQLNGWRFVFVLCVPMILTPLIAVPLTPDFLPVLVADYLGLHLFVFGIVQLVLMKVWGARLGRVSWPALGLLLLWCAIFGVALDRYVANFWPTTERFWIIAAMVIGAVPYMVTDALLVTGRSILGRLFVRVSFLVSLGIAITLDFQGLFFLIMIAPVLILFYLVFGTVGRDASVRGGALSSGLALGVVLAWALGVSFPLFQA